MVGSLSRKRRKNYTQAIFPVRIVIDASIITASFSFKPTNITKNKFCFCAKKEKLFQKLDVIYSSFVVRACLRSALI